MNIRDLYLSSAFGCLFCLAAVQPLLAQNEALNWHFGDSIALSFASGQPLQISPTSMNTVAGCAAISDATGNLLFYTNGGGQLDALGDPISNGAIWNRNHTLMYDMMGTEGGQLSADQSSLILPDHATAGNYYLLTMVDSRSNDRGLSYFYIDMSLNGGLGEVTTADQRIFNPTELGLAATPISDQSGYWIVIYGENSNELVVVRLDDTGFGEPQVQVLETDEIGTSIKISPDGSKIAAGNSLFDFDNESGEVVELLTTLPERSRTTHSFTPDSRFYYTTFSNQTLGTVVARYNVEAANILNSEELIDALSETSSTGLMQIGPNGNLYFIESDMQGDIGLSEIVCPSSSFSSAPLPTYNRFILNFGSTDRPYRGLPNYVDALFANLGTEDTTFLDPINLSICPGESINARQIGMSYDWSTNESAFSIMPNESGTYNLTITTDCGVTIDQQVVTVNAVPDAEIRPILFEGSCPGDSIPFFVLSSPAPDSVIWFDSTRADTIEFAPAEGQIIRATAFYACGSIDLSSQAPIIEVEEINAQIFVDSDTTQLCPGDDISLRVDGLGFNSVTWFNTEESLSITVSSVDSNAIYDVVLSGSCNSTDTLVADLDFSRCPPVCESEFPDIITPNGDGRNDLFRLFTNCPVEDYQLVIFNRWGQEVYSSNADERGWDGTKNGEPQPMDGYLYIASFRFPLSDELQQKDGQFTLIR